MDNKITIGFHFITENGAEYKSESILEVFYSLGETELGVVGEQFNTFLKQCGYYREHDYMLMEDLTEDELDAVTAFLDDYRREGATDESED